MFKFPLTFDVHTLFTACEKKKEEKQVPTSAHMCVRTHSLGMHRFGPGWFQKAAVDKRAKIGVDFTISKHHRKPTTV